MELLSVICDGQLCKSMKFLPDFCYGPIIPPPNYFVVKYIKPFIMSSPLIWIWNPHITITIHTPNNTNNMVGGYGMNGVR